MQKLAIKSIKKIDGKRHVYDLSVGVNHNFFIGDNQLLTHNCDFLSLSSQAALRNMIEEYNSVCRWLLTANYPHKVIPALHSRCQGFHIDRLDMEQFQTRVATILISEGVNLTEDSLDILDDYIKVTYPDLRKCINLLQQNCTGSVLKRPGRSNSNGTGDYLVKAVALFKTGEISAARKLICANATPEEYSDIYKLFYQNLEWWGDSSAQQDQAVVIIANRLKDHAIVADGEMNLAACLVELSQLSKK